MLFLLLLVGVAAVEMFLEIFAAMALKASLLLLSLLILFIGVATAADVVLVNMG